MPTDILDGDHVARFVRRRQIMRAPDGGVAGGFPDAFSLRGPNQTRPSGEKYLSANWLEYYSGTTIERRKSVLEELRQSLTVKSDDALAVVSIGEISKIGVDCGRRLRVLHEPTASSPSYAAIRGLSLEDREIPNLIASQAIVETVEISEIDGSA